MPDIFEVYDDRFSNIVSPESVLETVVDGFDFIEGVIWHPERKEIVFSDIIGDTMYRWTETNGLSVFRQPSNMANGNVFDRQGRILTCEHATSQVIRTEENGSVTIVASHYEGKQLNSPNDVVVRHDGTIYFTDPNFGRLPRVGVPRPQELPFQAVYRLEPVSLELLAVVDDFENPNGLCFSLDQSQLFVNDSPRQHIRIFDVQPDGGLAGGEVWAELKRGGVGAADGLKVDSRGNLYCCGPGGIHVFDQVGAYLGIIKLPEQAANFNWGDEDLSSLYICASTTLYRLRMNTPGLCMLG